jgi:hypothetical protein
MAAIPNNTAVPTFMGMNSAQIGQISTIGQVAGVLQSGLSAYFAAKQQQIQLKSQASSYQYQAEMGKINARMAEGQAQQIMRAGAQQSMISTMQAGQQMASYRTALAARGGQAGVGSAAEVTASARIMSAIDKMTMNSNTVRAAESKRMEKVGIQNQSNLLGVSARGALASAGTISPYSAMSTSLIGGGTSVLNSWYKMNRSVS